MGRDGRYDRSAFAHGPPHHLNHASSPPSPPLPAHSPPALSPAPNRPGGRTARRARSVAGWGFGGWRTSQVAPLGLRGGRDPWRDRGRRAVKCVEKSKGLWIKEWGRGGNGGDETPNGHIRNQRSALRSRPRYNQHAICEGRHSLRKWRVQLDYSIVTPLSPACNPPIGITADETELLLGNRAAEGEQRIGQRRRRLPAHRCDGLE